VLYLAVCFRYHLSIVSESWTQSTRRQNKATLPHIGASDTNFGASHHIGVGNSRNVDEKSEFFLRFLRIGQKAEFLRVLHAQ